MTTDKTTSTIADKWLHSPRYAGTAEPTILAMKLKAKETEALLDDALTVIGHDAEYVRAEAQKIRARGMTLISDLVGLNGQRTLIEAKMKEFEGLHMIGSRHDAEKCREDAHALLDGQAELAGDLRRGRYSP